jgi:hypothetical protein
MGEKDIGEDLEALTWYLKESNSLDDPVVSKKLQT